jgi:hypothetical protein
MSKRFAVLALVAVAWVVPSSFAADAPAAKADEPKPATSETKPARTLIKVTGPVEPGSKELVTALVDVNDAPDYKEWGQQAAEYALKWYPELCKQLASPGFTPPREFKIIIKKDRGVAYTQGGAITINTDYLSKNKGDWGMVAHELVHVIQRYRRGNSPDAGWLTEGIADYVRYFVVEPGAKNARFDVNRASYKRGYQPAAGLLNYIEKKKGAGTVAKLNQALREGKFGKTTFKEITGGEPDELWEEFKASVKAAKPAKPAASAEPAEGK